MLTVPSITGNGVNPEKQVQGNGPLKQTEIYRLRDFYGFNTVNTGNKRVWYQLLFSSLLHPFNILLSILATTSGIAGEYETMAIMLIMVLLSTVLRFYQEMKSEVAVESLLQFVATKVTVIRNDMVLFKDLEYVIPSSELVPGDWIKLCPGDLIPADVELINAKDFYVSQAALTGEAIPVLKYNRGRQGSWQSPVEAVLQGLKFEEAKKNKKVKFSPARAYRYLKSKVGSILGIAKNFDDGDTKDAESGSPLNGVNFSDMDRPDVCFMGSAVISGKATCRVVNTGQRTIFGKLAKELGKQKEPNSFQLGVRRISWLFFVLMIVMVPPVLLLQGFLHKDWFKAFMFALSVAVGLTPEMLPMIVNTTLSKGAVDMSKKKCIVKQLDAIIIMGGVDILCTDKTGTLTDGVVTLYKHVNCKGATSPLPLLLGYLNAHFQTCHESPLDAAITGYYTSNQNGQANITEGFTFIDEIPFDFVRRRLSVVVQDENKLKILICKGAVEEMLAVCKSVVKEPFGGSQNLVEYLHGSQENVEELSNERKAHLNEIYEKLSEDGLRVIGVGYKVIYGNRKQFSVENEKDLIFVGFLAFLDPPKESTKQAIQNLLEHNVGVKVLTGDSPLVCKKICTEIGLKVEQIVTGQEMAAMLSPEKKQEGTKMVRLKKIAEEYNIFAKLTPIQKSDIVKALRANGHVVGFLGDGINDAPALSEADVGISVDTGMDICKESADIILLEKDLTVIGDAVVTGRETYGNTLKYIVMGISANFGNVFSILIASAWLPFEPMASLHILVQNLLYDTSQIAIPWDKMDPEFLLVPHTWSMRKVVRFMVMIGPWSSLFDMATFLFLWYYIGIQTADDQGQVRLFQSSWFCVGILTQTLIVHLIRTPKVPFFESRASIQMTAMTLIIMCIGLSLPYIPYVSSWMTLVPLSWEMYPFMGAVVISYSIVTQISKIVYLWIFKEWY